MDTPLVFFGAVIAAGLAAQWIAWRFKVPSILLLLALGFVLGYFFGVDPDEVIGRELLFPIVSIAVAVILFEGGLSLRLRDINKSRDVVFRLVTLGVLVCWGLSTFACIVCFQTNWRIAAITGAILTVTGPTVIGPMLRHVRPIKSIGSVIKWEGIVIDPVGAVLAVLVFEALTGDGGAAQIAISLLRILVIGMSFGYVAAQIVIQSIRRYLLPDFLHVPMVLSFVIVTFILGNMSAHEGGLVAVTVMGIVMGNQKEISVRHLLEFKENLQILLISCLFVILAARIEPGDIWELGWGGIVFLLLLILVIRPASVLVSTVGSRLGLNERLFLCTLAPRGIVAAAVSSVFALELTEHHGHELPGDPEQIVSITFLVIVGTVSVYGTVAGSCARWLGLASTRPQGILFAGAHDFVRELARTIQSEGVQVLLVDTNYRNVTAARLAGLPATCDSIVSEFVSEEMDFGGIGRLLAMTPNEDLNSLASLEFAAVFGRGEVFQLSTTAGGVGNRKQPTHLRGRRLFDSEATFDQLNFRFSSGGQIKKTRITKEFSYDDFVKKHGTNSTLLCLLSESGELRIDTVDTPLKPQPGDKVIAMVDQEAIPLGTL